MIIRFVLVQPATPGNVGSAARAINTMGFSELAVVDSQCHLEDEAKWLAHGSRHILDGILEFPTLEAALADCDWAIGTTARRRLQADHYLIPEQAKEWAQSHVQSEQRLAVVFGRENNGLNNEELALCDVLSTVPLANPSPSINLAQSVMIYAYSLASLPSHTTVDTQVSKDEWQHMSDRVNGLLDRLDLYESTKLRQWVSEMLPLAGERPTRFMLSIVKRIEERMAR